MLKKSYTVVKKKGRHPKNKISFIASTETQDRYGDIVNQRGWALEAYDRNPVVLFNHQANSLPIGKGLVRVKDGQLLIDVEFDQDDEFARKIEKKARGGFLNAVSVGFNPIEAVSRSELPKDHPAYSTRGGQFFNKSELLEVSIVTIPANSEATVSAKNISKLDRLSVRDLIVEAFLVVFFIFLMHAAILIFFLMHAALFLFWLFFHSTRKDDSIFSVFHLLDFKNVFKFFHN